MLLFARWCITILITTYSLVWKWCWLWRLLSRFLRSRYSCYCLLISLLWTQFDANVCLCIFKFLYWIRVSCNSMWNPSICIDLRFIERCLIQTLTGFLMMNNKWCKYDYNYDNLRVFYFKIIYIIKIIFFIFWIYYHFYKDFNSQKAWNNNILVLSLLMIKEWLAEQNTVVPAHIFISSLKSLFPIWPFPSTTMIMLGPFCGFNV